MSQETTAMSSVTDVPALNLSKKFNRSQVSDLSSVDFKFHMNEFPVIVLPLPPQVDVESQDMDTKVPDGGLRAWSTLLGSFLVSFCQVGYTSSFGVYQDYFVRVYITNQSPSTISWIGSFNAFLLVSGGIIVGRLYDRGYFYALLWGGSFLTILSLFLLSLAEPNHYYQIFLAYGLGAGLGGGISYIPSIAILSQYFSKYRSLSMAVVACGASLGAIIQPIILNQTISRLGFGAAVRISAAVEAGLLLIACLLMRTRVKVQPSHIKTTAVLKKLVHDGVYMTALVAIFLFTIGFYFPQFYLQLDSISHNLSKRFSFYSLVILSASSIFGRVLSGLFANRLGVVNLITGSTFCLTAIIFGMIGLSSTTSVCLIAIFYGFFSGVFVGLLGPLIATLTDDMSELGVRMGVAFCACGMGTLIGSPISGELLTSKLIWWRPVVFSGMTMIMGSILFLLMLYLLHRRKSRSASM